MVIALLIIGLLVLAFLGVPLFLIVSAGTLLGYSFMEGHSIFGAGPDDVDVPRYMMIHMFRLARETSVIVALPLFTFAGYLLAESKAPTRLVNLSRALLGWAPGGLAIVALVACSVFTAFSGATGVTVIALGGLLLPALLKDGYRERFSLGLLTSCGSMGLLLPPSLALILFGIVAGNNVGNMDLPGDEHYAALGLGTLKEDATPAQIEEAHGRLSAKYKKQIEDGDFEAEWSLEELEEAYAVLVEPEARRRHDWERQLKRQTSVSNLFLAGILPCLIMVFLLAGYSVVKVRGLEQARPPFSWPAAWKAFREAAWEAPIPVLILGGIYGGVFTITDAAVVTAFYVLVVEVFIYRDIRLVRDLPRVTIDSMMLIGGILLILMCAITFTAYLVDQDVPAKVIEWIESYVDSRIGFLLALNLVLLVVGVLIDIFSATVIVVPLILPMAVKFGVHPIHLGIVFLTNLQIGFLTPPVGLGLFLSSSRFEKPVQDVFRAALPFLLLLFLALLAITYVPWLSMALIGSGSPGAP